MQPLMSMPRESRISVTQPYDAPSILSFLHRRAIPGVEQVDGGTYRRTADSQEGNAWLAIDVDAAGERLTVRLGDGKQTVPSATLQQAAAVFDAQVDAPAMERTLGTDPTLAALNMRGLRVAGAWSAFELGIRAILGQQITVAAARTLASRLCQRFGSPLVAGAPDALSHVFPTPEILADADVAAIGMPRRRAETINRFARAVADGQIDFESAAGRKQAPARLLELPGIGKWTVGYFTMRALKDPDAFPSGDIALIRAAQRLGIAQDARSLDRAAERWRPWRAYATVRLWASLSLP